jgi:fatty-acyl-CoA synthase
MRAEIQELVKDRKGSVQSPKQVIVADSVPLTGLGEPDKTAFRERYWTGERAVG